MRLVTMEELHDHIGTETGRSDWFTIDQERINAFADTTVDHQWIHVDTAAAQRGPFGTTIAHGFLTLSLLSHLTSQASLMPRGATMMINYGTNKVRFLNPVAVGSRIRAVSTLTDVTHKDGGRILMTSNVVVEIEEEQTPALVAETLTLAVMSPDD